MRDKFICTAERPWLPLYDAKHDMQIVHPDAVEGEQEDGWPSGDLVNYECSHCKHRWKVELPQ